MITDTLIKCGMSLEERGLPADSFFEIILSDESVASERDINWSSISEQKRVSYFEGTKSVFVCTLPVIQISVHHDGLSASINIPKGCSAFQAVKSETVILDGKKRDTVIGRVIGIVKNKEVVEEKFINGIEHAVVGMKK